MTLRYVALSPSELEPSKAELAARLRVPRGEVVSGADTALSRLTRAVSPACTVAYGELDGALSDLLGECGGFLRNCRYIALLSVTLGHGADREIAAAGRIGSAAAFITDAVASAMAEAAADAAEAHLRALTPHVRWGQRRSPGYGAIPLSLQATLLTLTGAHRYLGIALNESDLMIPTKSITAILGGNDEA